MHAVVYLLAIGSAVLYGTADFLGGLASRRASTIAILLVAQAAGLLPLAVILPLLPAVPAREDLIWSGVAGLAGSAGVGLLYRALAIGTMSLVAPTTAVCGVMIPVLADAAGGERLPALTMAGIVLALVAIVLVSQQYGNTPRPDAVHAALPPGLALALLSGVAIGLFFLALARTSASAGLWPLLVSRSVSVVLFSAVAVAKPRVLRMPAAVLRIALACGTIDMLANALYILASRAGPLSVVVTLASLYPASTVVLARVVVGERLSRTQMAGIACALVAVVMIVGAS